MRISASVTTDLLLCLTSGVVAVQLIKRSQVNVNLQLMDTRTSPGVVKSVCTSGLHLRFIVGFTAPGSFDIVSGKHMATVLISAGVGLATGSWNGPEGVSDVTQDDLGNLVHQGECWMNDRAKVCASR
jgi:hypothetical protein